MTIIALSTFEENGEKDEFFEYGTVEVTLRNETRRVLAYRGEDGGVTAMGLTGRYQQGMKTWPATVTRCPLPVGRSKWVEYATFGRDDQSSRFKKEDCIFFAD